MQIIGLGQSGEFGSGSTNITVVTTGLVGKLSFGTVYSNKKDYFGEERESGIDFNMNIIGMALPR
jgi:hypothetical protein